MEIRYNAIVLRKKEVGETDRLYTLYTESKGKVQLVAKGVRKSEAKLAGQLETLMQGLVIVVKGRGTGRIAGAVAEKNFLHLRTDGDILRRVLETVNTFEHFVEWDEPDEELFQLLLSYLVLANEWAEKKNKEKTFLVTEGFFFQLFAFLGYKIETGQCAVSGEKLRSGEQHFFSPSAGGVISAECSSVAENVFPISESAIKLIRLFLSNRLDTLPRIKVTEGELREVTIIATRFAQWISQ